VSKDSFVVQRLRNAGAISKFPVTMSSTNLLVVGKANLSELSNFKSPKLPWAYSDLGGQCRSAYVQRGFVRGEGVDGPGNPSGSSSGSAVALSAGFAAATVGTDTRGSIVSDIYFDLADSSYSQPIVPLYLPFVLLVA
jgi:Asp-tRNA(Asn)/Glu-tRNA(Gln) amidotransferase A subunit family amidase